VDEDDEAGQEEDDDLDAGRATSSRAKHHLRAKSNE
jgi:hypothetical protein